MLEDVAGQGPATFRQTVEVGHRLTYGFDSNKLSKSAPVSARRNITSDAESRRRIAAEKMKVEDDHLDSSQKSIVYNDLVYAAMLRQSRELSVSREAAQLRLRATTDSAKGQPTKDRQWKP